MIYRRKYTLNYNKYPNLPSSHLQQWNGPAVRSIVFILYVYHDGRSPNKKKNGHNIYIIQSINIQKKKIGGQYLQNEENGPRKHLKGNWKKGEECESEQNNRQIPINIEINFREQGRGINLIR